MIKAIIFDFDGVLVESLDIKTRSFGILFEKEGKEIVEKVKNYHLQNTGVSRYVKIKNIYKNLLFRNLSEYRFKKLCKDFSSLVVDAVIKANYVQGAKEFLDKNLNNYSYFVCSATPQKELLRIIKGRKMSNYFKGAYGSPAKKAEIIKRIIKKSDFEPKNCVLIGDALNDYNAAKTNHISFIAREINKRNDIFREIKCLKIGNLHNLSKILSNLNKQGKKHEE